MKAARTRALNAKHAGTRKHAGTAKHSPSAQKRAATAHKQVARRTAAQTKAAKQRALAIGGWWDCCSAEALGASLRLAGHRVSEDDVLELHVAAGGSEDVGVSILAALEAASEFGLAGFRPVVFGPRVLERGGRLRGGAGDFGEFADGTAELGHPGSDSPEIHVHDASVILGVDLPGPHAVLSDGAHWWSWSRPWAPSDFPRAVVEEAWAVTWQ